MTAAFVPVAVVLEGQIALLEPLTRDHVPGLTAAAQGPRQTFALTTVPPDEAGMLAYVEAALAEQTAGRALPFASRALRSGQIVGSTRFLNIERWAWPASGAHLARPGCPDAVEIGATWLTQSAQRGGANTEAKLMMLAHAFEAWRVRRVTLKTDARNTRSRTAIERIGARFEGVLRAHVPSADGGVRDSAMYSILEDEWPDVRTRLEGLLRRG